MGIEERIRSRTNVFGTKLKYKGEDDKNSLKVVWSCGEKTKKALVRKMDQMDGCLIKRDEEEQRKF